MWFVDLEISTTMIYLHLIYISREINIGEGVIFRYMPGLSKIAQQVIYITVKNRIGFEINRTSDCKVCKAETQYRTKYYGFKISGRSDFCLPFLHSQNPANSKIQITKSRFQVGFRVVVLKSIIGNCKI